MSMTFGRGKYAFTTVPKLTLFRTFSTRETVWMCQISVKIHNIETLMRPKMTESGHKNRKENV